MKIAISNIAWQIEEEATIAQIMQDMGIKGVEIAPTKIWQSPLSATDQEIKDYRNFWQSKGIEIVSMQALLFGRPDLTIFASKSQREATINYLSAIIEIGSKLGVNVLVFGSPKNRTIGDIPFSEAEEIAIDFFSQVGDIAAKYGMMFCIEPNPKAYNCDFIVNSRQGFDLVNKANHQGFGLHLDAAGMTLSEEKIKPALSYGISRLCHFHISEPYLAQVGDGKVDHQAFGETLKSLNYSGWKSIEMRAQDPKNNTEYVIKALKTASYYYV
jgi:sugar phosphate isomerase/epimerase